MSAVLLVFPGHFQHAVWHDLESFIHVLHWMCLRFHQTDKIRLENLKECINIHYTRAYRGQDGTSYGGHAKLEVLCQGRIPFKLRNGSVDRPRGLYSLLIALSKVYGEHYAWLKATSRLPAIPSDSEARPRPPANAMRDAKIPAEEEGPSLSKFARRSRAPVTNAIVKSSAPLPPSTTPKPVLDYAEVTGAFEDALIGDDDWTDDPKGEDRFVSLGMVDGQSAGTKRRSDGSSEQTAKRARHASQSNADGTNALHAAQLHSIGE